MRKSILFSAVLLAGLSLTAVAPLAGQGPGRGTPGPAVNAPGPGPNDPAPGRGGRRGFAGGRVGGRPDAGPAENGRGVARGRMADALGLPNDQQAAAVQLGLKTRDDIAPLADKLRLARRELRRAVFADKADAATTRKLASEVAALGQQIAQKRLDTERAFAALLTDEQRLKLRTGIGGADGRGRGPGRRGGGRGAFGPPESPVTALN